MEDAELVALAQDGDREAFAELVRRHQGRVLALCRSMLCDDREAEDAAQEVFVKAFTSLGSFRGGAAFGTWLHRVAANACLDLLRRRARRKTESLDALLEAHGDALGRLIEAPAPGPSPEDVDLVRRALAALPDDYRAVLVLREQEGLTYEEIAEALDCTLDAVKARLRRARVDLEEKLRHFLRPPASNE